MNSLKVTALQTRIFRQQEELLQFIMSEVPKDLWQENCVIAITSKLVSLHENRLVPRDGTNKLELIKKESEVYLGEIAYGCHLSIKQGQLLATAGIDESNSENGEYILYPMDPYQSANNLRAGIQKQTGLKNLGVLITDSHSGPLRHGVLGSCVSFAGFKPIKNRIGDKDIFGRPLKMTKQNQADALAAAAVLMMGEAAERCPIAIISGAPIEFSDKNHRDELEVPVQQDMYLPLYEHLLNRPSGK
jgi:coenzyme F420-0:L-glutamate ligase